MKRRRMFTTVVLAAALVLGATLFLSQDSFALSIFDGVNAAKGNGQPTELFGVGGVVSTITNLLLFLAGALGVIMLIVGGLRYAISGGNSSAVTAAKNTVLYAIVGLVIAVLAYSIITFVLGVVSPGAGTGAGFTNV